MKFSSRREYSATVFDKDAKIIEIVIGLHFENKAHVLRWAKFVAKKHKMAFGHVSVCDDETSEIVRYKPCGNIWD